MLVFSLLTKYYCQLNTCKFIHNGIVNHCRKFTKWWGELVFYFSWMEMVWKVTGWLSGVVKYSVSSYLDLALIWVCASRDCVVFSWVIIEYKCILVLVQIIMQMCSIKVFVFSRHIGWVVGELSVGFRSDKFFSALYFPIVSVQIRFIYGWISGVFVLAANATILGF